MGESKKLYRYMSFDSFVNIIQEKSLFFADPLLDWEDEYEGYLYKFFIDEDVKNLREIFLDKFEKRKKLIQYTMDMNHDGRKFFAMSWCKEKDSMVMWNAYSYDTKAIMIEVDRSALNNIKYIFNSNLGDETRVTVADIIYDDVNVETQFKNSIFMQEDDNILVHDVIYPFLVKRECFSYEKEVRAFIFKVITENLDEGSANRLDIPDISSFILQVLVHPKAKDYFVKTVSKFCELNSIKFGGRSEILDIEFSL